jgi:hypothetical protein
MRHFTLLTAVPLKQHVQGPRQQQGNNENFEPTIRRQQSMSSNPVIVRSRTVQKMHWRGLMVKGYEEILILLTLSSYQSAFSAEIRLTTPDPVVIFWL